MVSTQFLRVCRRWQREIAMFFFKLKKLRVIFCFKTRGKIVFTLACLDSFWQRCSTVVHMHIARADSDVGFRRLEAIQVCIFVEWLCNNIAFDFNIKFLRNIWTQAWNIAILRVEFATKNCFGCCGINFWSLPYVFRGHTGMHQWQMVMQ